RLAGAVRAEQADGLAALNRDRDVAQHRPLLEALPEIARRQPGIVRDKADRAARRLVALHRLLSGFDGAAAPAFCDSGITSPWTRPPVLGPAIMRLTLLFRSTTAVSPLI